jgi:hypothetical protein
MKEMQMSTRRWRFYTTAAGRQPVRDFLASLTDEDQAAVLAEMSTIRHNGLRAARHLRGDLYEVRVAGIRQDFVLSSPQKDSTGMYYSPSKASRRRPGRRRQSCSPLRSSASSTGEGVDAAAIDVANNSFK